MDDDDLEEFGRRVKAELEEEYLYNKAISPATRSKHLLILSCMRGVVVCSQ